MLAFDLAYGGGGKAKKAIVKPKVVPVALPPEPEPVSQKAEATNNRNCGRQQKNLRF